MSKDPWSDLAIPTAKDDINARRVSETTKWNFYWGRDSERNCLLVMRHDNIALPRERLPKLKGIEVISYPPIGDVKPSLVLKLLDNGLRDIFHRLCVDVISSTATSVTETEAVSTTIARTWRWHHLLRGGATGLLSAEEQKGLAGELLVLERYFLPAFSAADSVSSWLGPLEAPQDFVFGRAGVESKARSTRGANEVLISSEFQLDSGELSRLFLHLSVFDTADADDSDGFTLTEIAQRIRDELVAGGEIVCDRYDALLAAAGFRYEDDYSSFRWTGGERSIFEVSHAFPKLIPSKMPKEIKDVKYALSITDCSAFMVAPETMRAALAAARA